MTVNSMLQTMYHVNDWDIQRWIEYKQKRIVKRMRKDERKAKV